MKGTLQGLWRHHPPLPFRGVDREVGCMPLGANADFQGETPS